MRTIVKQRIDLPCLTIDPDIRQERAAAVAKHLNGDNVDNVEAGFNAGFKAVILQTAVLERPRRRHEREGRA